MAILLSLSLAIGMFSGIGVSAEETEETREEQEIQELWTPEEEAEEALNTAGDLSLEELATAELSEADIPEVVSAAEIEERGHVNRLWEQEEDLNTVIFQNRDGTKTMYYFAEPVKYVDATGQVRDKSNGIREVAQARYVAEYRYTNTANDVKSYFPGTLNSEKGILLEYGDIRIEVMPTHAVQTGPAVELEEEAESSETVESTEEAAAEEEQNPSEPLVPAEEAEEALPQEDQPSTVLAEDTAVQQPVEEEENRSENLPPVEEVQEPEVFVPQRVEVQAAESLKKTLEAEAEQARPAEVVEYEGIFGPHTTLRYTPTFGGFKEDIILSRNIGVNEFSFVVDAGELQVTAEGGALFFLNPLTGTIEAQFDAVYVYDSFTGERTAESSHESWNNQILSEPLPDGRYLITLVADSAFLNDPSTVYPVYIDPSLTINTQGSGTEKSIQDIVVYSGRPQYNHSSNPYMHVGYYDSAYKAGRVLVKFPGLTNHALFKSLDASQITGATYYIYKSNDSLSTQTTSVSAYRYTGVSWNESTAKCGNISWNSYGDLQETKQVSGTAQGYVGFNILGAAKLWKTSTSAASLGLMLKNSNESSRSYDRNFLSTRYGSNKPYVTLSWNAPTPSGISNNGVYYFQNVCSGKYLDVYNADTANNTNLIQFGLTGNANQRFKLERDSSGYYRILAQHTSLKRVLLLNTSNQVVLSDDCSSERALWRIKDEGSGQYSFINKANEGTYAYAMSNMGSGSSGAQIKGESYTNTTRLRWRLRSAVTSISLSESAVWIAYGNTVALTCSINPAGSYNTTVYWTTNDPAVATVSSNGHTATINAVGYGSTVITARTADGNYTANCTVTVIYQYNIHESLFLGQMLDEELMNHQLTFNQARSILQCLQSNNGTISVEQLSAIMGFTCAQSGAHLIELTYATSLYNMSLGDAVFFYNQQLSSDRQTALSYLFFQVLTSISSGIRVTSPEFNPNSRLDMVEKNLLENGVTFKPLHGSLTAYKMPSPHGLIGVAFENYLKENLGGSGSFSVNGREFDGNGYGGKRWYEAKSGQYWEMCMSNNEKLGKFQSTAGDCRKIAEDNGATYEIISNVPIPQSIKEWLQSKNIPFTEMLF